MCFVQELQKMNIFEGVTSFHFCINSTRLDKTNPSGVVATLDVPRPPLTREGGRRATGRRSDGRVRTTGRQAPARRCRDGGGGAGQWRESASVTEGRTRVLDGTRRANGAGPRDRQETGPRLAPRAKSTSGPPGCVRKRDGGTFRTL